tara:strand:- start:340 stop:633 length:294 start_codon:yes stop_codon:yes gene_type:complete
VSDLKALGASEEQIAAAQLEAVKHNFEVWEENWEAVMMFLRMQTQWNVSMNGLIGLNYQALETLIRLYHVKEPVELFEKVQVIERAALVKMNSKRAS